MAASNANFICPPKPAGIRQSTVQRLFSDLKEVMNYKLPTISALPLEDNLLEWHCNLRAHESTPYAGGLFHIILNFPENYPESAPSLRLCTSINHPNVMGTTLCLDMLSEFKEKYQGWSPAYSVLSLLLQLQSFLFRPMEDEEDVRSDAFKKAARASVQESRSFECTRCRHRSGRPWPPVEKTDQAPAPANRIALLRQQYTCYYSRRSFEEDCLGVGLCINRNVRTGRILSISSPLDLVSLRSYMRHNVRRSAYNETFTHWLPVYICKEHAVKAIPMARKMMSTIYCGTSKRFEPAQALEILSALLRSMVVDMLLDRIHVSTKSLTGFAWFFRMLVEFGRIHPEINKLAKEKVEAFIASEENRNKDAVADLGSFLAMWLITDLPWSAIAPAVLSERFDRDVFWTLRKYPELGKLDGPEDEDRAIKTFVTSTTSLRHVLFFATLPKFVRPADRFCADLDQNLGELPPPTEEALLALCRRVMAVNSFDDFFTLLGQEKPTKERLNEMLRAHVASSLRRGYHEKQLEVTSVEDAAKQEQDKIKPLWTFLLPAEPGHAPVMTSDERLWQKSCLRFGIKTLPEGEPTWRELYIRMNLQEFIQKLNDASDFKKFYNLLDLSAPYVTRLEWITFNPDRIESRYYFLTQILTRLTCLREFKIIRHSFDLHPNACKAITKGLKRRPDGLRTLDISMTNTRPEALAELIPGLLSTTQLRTLDLSGNPIGGGCDPKVTKLLAKFIRRHPTLEVLKMNNCTITDVEAQVLAPALEFHTTLRVLQIQRNPLSSTGLGMLLYNVGFVPTLAEIDCSAISNAGDSGRGAMLSPGDAMARMLEISTSLVSMNCWKTPFQYSDRLFDALAHNRSLRTLDLGDTGLPNSYAPRLGRALIHNTSLKILNLERCQLSMLALYKMCQPGVRDARGFSVEELRMNGNDLSQTLTVEKRDRTAPHAEGEDDDDDENARETLTAADMLRVFKKLRVLELKSSSLTPSSGAIIGGLLSVAPAAPAAATPASAAAAPAPAAAAVNKESVPIERLFLALNNLDALGTKAIADSLATNTSLRCLDLSRNHLGVSGSRSIAAVLAANHPLEELNLFGNAMGVEGVRCIAGALHRNTHLKILDLGMNRARDKGAVAVAQMLRANRTLEVLKMRLNLIAGRGAQVLLSAIVTQAELAVAPTSAAAAAAPSPLPRALMEESDAMSVTSSEGQHSWGNQTLKTLLLNNNPIPNEAIVLACKALQDSKHNLTLDLVKRLAEADPERRQYTVWVSPLPKGCSSDELARFFYANKTGAIRNITICQSKKKRGGRGGARKQFAFVEFVDENSVELALHLPPQGLAKIRSQDVSIARTGVRSGRSVDNMEMKNRRAARGAPARRGRVVRRGGRGGRRH